MTPDLFRPHVGSRFAIAVEGGDPVVLTLEDVELTGPGHEFRAEPFTLSFSGPADRMAPQGTLALEHDALGRIELFLVPIGPGRYESVFN